MIESGEFWKRTNENEYFYVTRHDPYCVRFPVKYGVDYGLDYGFVHGYTIIPITPDLVQIRAEKIDDDAFYGFYERCTLPETAGLLLLYAHLFDFL